MLRLFKPFTCFVELYDGINWDETYANFIEVTEHKQYIENIDELHVGIEDKEGNDDENSEELVEEIETLLDEVEGVGYVHSKFYLMASDLHKQDANYAEYYRSSLRFLGCTDLATLSQQEQASQVINWGITTT